MRIKRTDILKAIRTEPLKAGAWIHEDWNSENPEIIHKGCKVCAVGAVFRQKGIKDEEIDSRASEYLMGGFNMPTPNEEGDEEAALKDKHYLSALSIKFEKLARRLGHGKRTRAKLAEFVKKNFPKQFNVSI